MSTIVPSKDVQEFATENGGNVVDNNKNLPESLANRIANNTPKNLGKPAQDWVAQITAQRNENIPTASGRNVSGK